MSGVAVLFLTLSTLIVASSLLLFVIGTFGTYFFIGLLTLILKLKIFRFYCCFFGDYFMVVCLLSFVAIFKSSRSVFSSLFRVCCCLGIETKTLSEIYSYEKSFEVK
jgi:hypothetical protein